MIPLLTDSELQSFLAANPGWKKTAGGELERTFELKRFPAAIAFVAKVGAAAEAQDHHPDLDIRFSQVTVRASTHDSKGLTARDVKLAAECDRIFGQG